MMYIQTVIDSYKMTATIGYKKHKKVNSSNLNCERAGYCIQVYLKHFKFLLGSTWLSFMTKLIQTELCKKMSVFKTQPNLCETSTKACG